MLGALAPLLDPAVLPLYHQLQGRPWATEPLVARLFGHGRRALLPPDSPLVSWRLVRAAESAPAEPPPLIADPLLPFWLQGETPLDPLLVGSVRPLDRLPPLDEWPVASVADRLRILRAAGQPARLVVEAPPGSGRSSFAAAVASALGLPAIRVDPVPPGTAWPLAWMLVQRHAAMTVAMPVWRAPLPAPSPAAPLAPFDAVCVEPGDHLARDPALAEVRVALPPLGRDTKCALITRLIPSSAAWPAPVRLRLADRPGVTVGDLAAIGRSSPASAAEAETYLRELSAMRLGHLADRLGMGFEWDDLVLPEPLHARLRDLAFEAETRAAFWERPEVRRLFPGGRGLVTLFAGPSGTGKTMAAQVIARSIGVDIFRIDLATLLSKYIGETAKNLKRIFARAASIHALLLFDEADALFANRTEVKDSHDRYANTDTNYLLQQLENFSGLAILATNRKTSIDTAFLRRIRYVFDFPRPEAADRGRLWHRLAAPILGPAPAGKLAPALDTIAAGLELSGAQIKNALVATYFVARRRQADPGPADLVAGIERELAKEGRALSPRERQRLSGHV